MGSYSLLKEFGDDGTHLSLNPYWVTVVYSYKRQITFDRKKITVPGTLSISRSTDIDDAIRVSEPLIMYKDCVSLTTGSTKENHVATLNASFLDSGRGYMSKVFPGDWCLTWIVYGEEALQNLIDRIKRGDPCNKIDDGLKFVGKVQSFRKSLVIDERGVKHVTLNLQAAAFSEFSNMLFYDTKLQQAAPFFTDLIGKLNIAIEELFSFDRNQGVDTNKFIPLAMNLILGTGAPADFANPSGELAIAAGPVKDAAIPVAYVVPTEVAKLLGRTDPSSEVGAVSYADLLDTLIGIQKYDNSGDTYRVFTPRGADGPERVKVFKNRSAELGLVGSFMASAIPFTNKPLWGLLNQFLNPIMNEMFTTLRVNDQGEVVPTLVVRQIPLSSDIMAGAASSIQLQGSTFVEQPTTLTLTRFLELPRWVAPPVLVRSFDIGRSDQARFNFFHVYGEPVMSQPLTDMPSQIVRNPPLTDETDCKRHGIRPFMSTVNCSPQDAAGEGARVWMEVATDFHAGMQLFYNGTVSLIGISAPICVGDAFEFDETVFMIEQVSHSCTIDGNGNKQFRTFLALTHGVRSETDINSLEAALSDDASEDQSTYPGMIEDDNTQYDPGTN